MERRLPSLLSRPLKVCVPAAVLLMSFGAGNASAARVPVNANAAALASLRHLIIGEHGVNHALGGHAGGGVFGPKKVTSGNWSGYADDGGKTYTLVTARWKEPAVTCSATNSMAAFWVGVDGYASRSVEQDGTLAWCDGGTPYYYTWWEMAPRNAVQVVGSAVKPGDEITASVTASVATAYTRYVLTVRDWNNPANTFTEHQTCARKTCLNSSAEWVAEAPAGSSGQYPLARFGTWAANDASVRSGLKTGTISSFPAYEITMTDRTTVLARPGPLNPAGTWFTDTWAASQG